MKYEIFIKPSAKKELEKSPTEIKNRLKEKIDYLAENPRPKGTRKIKGGQGDHYRVRVGDYRIIYSINDKEKSVVVFRVKHRGEVYLN